MNVEAAVSEAEVETATEAEAEAANAEGQIICVNNGCIVKAEGNR
jgi:hypothetical protein